MKKSVACFDVARLAFTFTSAIAADRVCPILHAGGEAGYAQSAFPGYLHENEPEAHLFEPGVYITDRGLSSPEGRITNGLTSLESDPESQIPRSHP